MSVSVLVALDAKSYEILSRVITQTAPGLNVMDLKIFHPSARLTSPAVSLQNFAAEQTIEFWIKPQAGSLWTDSCQSDTCTSSRSSFFCSFGRQITSRVRQGIKASRLLASKLTPARKSAQIICRQ
jgi:hypothetical protein